MPWVCVRVCVCGCVPTWLDLCLGLAELCHCGTWSWKMDIYTRSVKYIEFYVQFYSWFWVVSKNLLLLCLTIQEINS